ncbi:MAG: glycosyltransferase [Candidatus Omnitrophota bacterium]
MYISEVSGHHQATLAIEKSVRTLAPDCEIVNINGFGYAYPIIEKIINKAYLSVIKRTPKIWDYLYDNPKVVKKTQKIKEAIHKANHAKLDRLFRDFSPDTVVCTQAFPCGMVADYKKTYNLSITIIGVLTDYAPHAYWINEGVDYYIVPSMDAKERYVQQGVDEHKIKVFGIPVDQKFSESLEKNKIAEKLGLDLNIPAVLVMGGGQGLGPIRTIVKSLLASEESLQLMVVAGTNKRLIKWLRKIQSRSQKKFLVFEFVNNIDELMTVASLVVTKPGGITTTEALAKHLPMVIINPIPGQEVHNTTFLIKNGVAIRVDKADQISLEIESLLRAPHRLESMRQAAKEHSRPHSSMDIAKLILS